MKSNQAPSSAPAVEIQKLLKEKNQKLVEMIL